MGLPGSCPYPLPAADELQAHRRDYELFEIAQKLKYKVAMILDAGTDGWVPSDISEATKATHKEAFEHISKAVEEAESTGIGDMTVDDLKRIWPLDLP